MNEVYITYQFKVDGFVKITAIRITAKKWTFYRITSAQFQQSNGLWSEQFIQTIFSLTIYMKLYLYPGLFYIYLIFTISSITIVFSGSEDNK